MIRRFLMSSATILAVTAVPAFAQTVAEDNESVEIVVTAQKRSEKLQDIPLAVSVAMRWRVRVLSTWKTPNIWCRR